jgi:hypothetical protein
MGRALSGRIPLPAFLSSLGITQKRKGGAGPMLLFLPVALAGVLPYGWGEASFDG